jgi:chromosomal replication initiation ATPase DnaA
MKTKIFNKYVEESCELFGVSRDALFTKNKKRDIVDARHLLYYLCSERPMSLVYIQEYMMKNGYEITHSSIHHGIAIVKTKLDIDRDYVDAVEYIQSK